MKKFKKMPWCLYNCITTVFFACVVISNDNDNFTQRWTENPSNQCGAAITFNDTCLSQR